jgi:FtsH-binding integral membrane protein
MKKANLYGAVGLGLIAASLAMASFALAHSLNFRFRQGFFIGLGLVLVVGVMVWRKRAKEQGIE